MQPRIFVATFLALVACGDSTGSSTSYPDLRGTYTAKQVISVGGSAPIGYAPGQDGSGPLTGFPLTLTITSFGGGYFQGTYNYSMDPGTSGAIAGLESRDGQITLSAGADPIFVPSAWGPELGQVFPDCDFTTSDTLTASGTYANGTLSLAANGDIVCGGSLGTPMNESYIASKS